MNKKYEINMCEGSLIPKIARFAIPLILSNMLQLLFNAVDVIVVGRFTGKEALAAVGSTGSLVNLIINLFSGLSVGACIVAAKYFGRNDNDGLQRVVNTSIALAIVGGVGVGIIGFFASTGLLVMMKSPADVLPLSALYLKIYFCGMPFFMIYNFGSSVMRAVGDTKRPLYYLSFAGLTNIVLNLIFVICFKMGVAGVAIATVISQMISAVLVIRCLLKSDSGLKLTVSKIKFYKRELMQILKMGLPAGIQGSLFSLSNVLIQSSVNTFGSTVVAGNTAGANIEGFIYGAMNALHQAALTISGQNIGANKIKRIKYGLGSCILAVCVVGVSLSAFAIILSKPLLEIYSSDPKVIQIGQLRLLYICSLYFTCGIMDVIVGIVRGIGYAVMPMLISLFGACILRIIWIYTIFEKFHTLEVLYLSYPVSWIITSLMQFAFFIYAYKKLKKRKLDA